MPHHALSINRCGRCHRLDLRRPCDVGGVDLRLAIYTFRKSPLSPIARDVTYRQRKSLCILACGTFGVDLNRSESPLSPQNPTSARL